MRPLRDAMSLIDADEGDRRQRLQDASEETSATGNRFRRQEEEVQFAGFDLLQNFFASALGLIEVQAGGSNERWKAGHLNLKKRIDSKFKFKFSMKSAVCQIWRTEKFSTQN